MAGWPAYRGHFGVLIRAPNLPEVLPRAPASCLDCYRRRDEAEPRFPPLDRGRLAANHFEPADLHPEDRVPGGCADAR